MTRAPITFRLGTFPNEWPHPHFLGISNDGGFFVEWHFGEQVAKDSWILALFADPDPLEMYVILTAHDGQTVAHGAECLKLLADTLDPKEKT